METNAQKHDDAIYKYAPGKWVLMPSDLRNSNFSELSDDGGDDLGILPGEKISSTFKETEYLVMKLIDPQGQSNKFIYLGASTPDPQTWRIKADIQSMQSGAFVMLGKRLSECLITSCIKTALFLHLILDLPVICSLRPSNTIDTINNILRQKKTKKTEDPLLLVLCEDVTAVGSQHENVIKLEAQPRDFISLCKDDPKYLKQEIKRHIEELKSSGRYIDLAAKAKASANSPMQSHVEGGAELFENMRKLIRKHIQLRESDLVLVTLFFMFTYAFRKSEVIPILYIVSPEAGAGKTVMLTIAKDLCANPIDSSDLTAATLARYASTFETIIIDEYDQQERTKGLTGIINAGYRTAISNYGRSGPGKSTMNLNVASAKVIAGIGYPVAPTTHERSIFINLQVCRSTDEFPEVSSSGLAIDYLKGECQKWSVAVGNNFDFPILDKNYRIGWSRRSMENYGCLLKVAACLSNEILELAAGACKQHVENEKPEASKTLEMLVDILKIINNLSPGNIFRDQLSDALIALPGRPWKASAARSDSFSLYVGSVLKSYRVKTGTVRIGKATAKGYKRRQFDQLLDRFKDELSLSESTIND